ncbi:hypothetical protein H4R35_007605, partial [Dimargaris xerosporica]
MDMQVRCQAKAGRGQCRTLVPVVHPAIRVVFCPKHHKQAKQYCSNSTASPPPGTSRPARTTNIITTPPASPPADHKHSRTPPTKSRPPRSTPQVTSPVQDQPRSTNRPTPAPPTPPASPPRAATKTYAVQCPALAKSTGMQSNSPYRSLIDPKAPLNVQRDLYAELQKPWSPNAKPGYIYAYQKISKSRPRYSLRSLGRHVPITIKIGYTDNVKRRMREWSSQCDYEVHLLEVFPLAPDGEASGPMGSPLADEIQYASGQVSISTALLRRLPSRLQQFFATKILRKPLPSNAKNPQPRRDS